MGNIIVAIALLCGNPGYHRLGESEVLKCQQYYVNCASSKIKHKSEWDYADKLMECVKAKQSLGGGK